MSYKRKATDEQITESYARLGNIWKVAEELGMCGQSVHERLKKLGIDTSVNVFTDDDYKYLAERYVPYRNAGQLQTLADEMGRTKQFICRKAGELGLTDRNLPKAYNAVWRDLPREAAKAFWDDFKKSRYGIEEYCNRKHYGSQLFIDCMKRNFPEEYDEVVCSKKPKSKAYQRGRNFEYSVLKDMTKRGYLALRTPASKSPVDVYCIAKGELIFIQCKLRGAFPVKEWNEFFDYCESVGALPVMAEKAVKGISYHLLTGKKDGTKKRQPMTDWEPRKIG